MRIELFQLENNFIDSIKFLGKKENLKVENNRVIIEGSEAAKLRANINLILRCLKLYEDLIKWLKE